MKVYGSKLARILFVLVWSRRLSDPIPKQRLRFGVIKMIGKSLRAAFARCTLHAAGLDVDWSEYHRPFASAHELLRLPTYTWDNKNYWIEYKNSWCMTKEDPVAWCRALLSRAEIQVIDHLRTPCGRRKYQGRLYYDCC